MVQILQTEAAEAVEAVRQEVLEDQEVKVMAAEEILEVSTKVLEAEEWEALEQLQDLVVVELHTLGIQYQAAAEAVGEAILDTLEDQAEEDKAEELKTEMVLLVQQILEAVLEERYQAQAKTVALE